MSQGGAVSVNDVTSLKVMGCNFTANGRVLEGADDELHPAQEGSECDAGGGLNVVGNRKSYDKKLQVAIQDSRYSNI